MAGTMLAKELFNITISPLSSSTFASKWSEDDHISVITENGIHIFELIPSPLNSKRTIQVQRSFVYASDILPNDKYTEDANKFMVNWDRETVYTLIMDAAVSPKLNKANPLVPRVSDVEWSPKGLIKPNRCLCVVLTTAGAVEILLEIKKNWFALFEVCENWFNVQKNPRNCEEYELFMKRARKLQAVATTWSELLKNETETYAYLIIAYRSSDLAIWKIRQIEESSYENIEAPELVATIETESEVKINVVRWIKVAENKFLVAIGYLDGTVQFLNAEEDSTGNLQLLDFRKFALQSDRVSVTDIILVKQDDSSVELLVVKNVVLISLRLTKDGDFLEIVTSRSTAFPITGVSLLSQDKALVATENGKMFLTSISAQGIRRDMIQQKLFSNRVRCLGLSSSHNRMIFATVTSPNTMYDHLTLREPTTMHFFCLEGWTNPLNLLSQENNESSLSNHWDCLELIRLKAVDDQNYVSTLPNVAQNLSSSSIHELRKILWISTIKNVFQKSKQPVNEEIKKFIFLHSTAVILSHLAKIKQLSKDEKVCVGLLRKYLQEHLLGCEDKTLISTRAREALRASESLGNGGKEECSLCGGVIHEVPWKNSQCPIGHRLMRCSATLMQITSIKYRSCPICKLVFHRILDEIWEVPKCLFCDVTLYCDPRTSNSKSTVNMRNLSQSSEILKLKRENETTLDDDDADGEVMEI